MKEKSSDNRSRNWVCVCYPESLPDDWVAQLDDLHIPWICSPLHDRDINPDGEQKKAHFHLLFLFAGKKSFAQVKQITDMLHAPIPQDCASSEGAVRYMIHMDNPDKYQYSASDIVCHGGADALAYLQPTKDQLKIMLGDIVDWIEGNDITEFKDLVTYARFERFSDWFPLITESHTLFLNSYLRSRRHSRG